MEHVEIAVLYAQLSPEDKQKVNAKIAELLKKQEVPA